MSFVSLRTGLTGKASLGSYLLEQLPIAMEAGEESLTLTSL
jgi:hypothetical protein